MTRADAKTITLSLLRNDVFSPKEIVERFGADRYVSKPCFRDETGAARNVKTGLIALPAGWTREEVLEAVLHFIQRRKFHYLHSVRFGDTHDGGFVVSVRGASKDLAPVEYRRLRFGATIIRP